MRVAVLIHKPRTAFVGGHLVTAHVRIEGGNPFAENSGEARAPARLLATIAIVETDDQMAAAAHQRDQPLKSSKGIIGVVKNARADHTIEGVAPKRQSKQIHLGEGDIVKI